MKAVILLLICLAGCDANVPDITHEDRGGAGSSADVGLALEPITVAYTVTNSNGAASLQLKTTMNLLRMWVMQNTSNTRYQPTEWSCTNSVSPTCVSSFYPWSWALRDCGPDPVTSGAWKCKLARSGIVVGWASQSSLPGQSYGWGAQYFSNPPPCSTCARVSANGKTTGQNGFGRLTVVYP